MTVESVEYDLGAAKTRLISRPAIKDLAHVHGPAWPRVAAAAIAGT